MRKKSNFLLSMWLIVPAVVIMPMIGGYIAKSFNLMAISIAIVFPLMGLFSLWKSPRKPLAKTIVSIILVLLAIGGSSFAYRSNTVEPEPASGYDVSMNARGSFNSHTVFSLERKIFSEVSTELRERRKITASPDFTLSQTTIDNNDAVYEKVGAQNGLSANDVEKIYIKVSSHMSK